MNSSLIEPEQTIKNAPKEGTKDEKKTYRIGHLIGVGVVASIFFGFVITIIVLAMKNKLDSCKKEGFLLTADGAHIDKTTGAMKGTRLMTDGMTRKPIPKMWDEVNKTGYTSDGTISLGVGPGNGFDKPYENQLVINDLGKNNDGTNYQSLENLDLISRKIGSNQNNANNNIYTRAGSKPTKMIIEPNGMRGVIDAKYLPDRDKNYQIATVGTIIPVQGYDVNVERIGEYLIDTHFSQISKNGKHKRIPTAAGAIGGGSRMNKDEKLNFDNGDIDDAININSKAISDTLEVSNDKLIFKDGDKKIGVALDSDASSQQLQPDNTYVKGNQSMNQ